MKMNKCMVATMIGLSVGMGSALHVGGAVVPTTAPATTAPAELDLGNLKLTISQVTGMVQVRGDAAAKWEPAKAGMVLGVGAEFRTGPKSAVQFVIEPDHVVTLDRLGIVKVLQALRTDKKIITDLGMKYGRTNYTVEAGGVEHESKIHAPGTTLAIRGSEVTFEDSAAFEPVVQVRHSREVEYRSGRTVTTLQTGNISEGSGSAAESARNNTAVNLTPGGSIEDSEQTVLADRQLGSADLRQMQQLRQIQLQTTLAGLTNDDLISHLSAYSELVRFRVYDPAIVDGDVIKASFNGASLGEPFALNAEGAIFDVNLRRGSNLLVLESVSSSEGGSQLVGGLDAMGTFQQGGEPVLKTFRFQMDSVGEKRALQIDLREATSTGTIGTGG